MAAFSISTNGNITFVTLSMAKKFFSKELMVKTLVWRFGISLPLQMLVTYLFTSSIEVTLSLALISNLLALFSNYIYEILWKKYFKKRFKKNVYRS